MTRRVSASIVITGLAGAFALRLVGVAVLPEPVAAASLQRSPFAIVSVVGTSDLHGAATASNGVGGLPLLAGYVNNLRRVRAADGGAVVLIDSGDTFQGQIESDLSEGAFIGAAYNAMRYTAKAIGNHDFDFGALDGPMARQTGGDLRGALEARAGQARYPFLAANLIDEATGRPVVWPNVRPSIVVDAAGVKVGVIGVLTIDALHSTIAANVQGLRVTPLAPAIQAEASALRAAGAALIIVAAHAGGRCERFEDPADVSSCDQQAEIFRVARSLPAGLVDVIAAGHTHAGIAHVVNGIGIIEPFSRGQAFGRADIVFDRLEKRVNRVQVYAPHGVCARQDAATGACVSAAAGGVPARYEGALVIPDSTVAKVMEPGLKRVRRLQTTRLGVSLPAPILRAGTVTSPLGDLVADAIRNAVPGAAAAVINNATRGLWADLPRGPLTFGRVYAVFPFDNRVAHITLSGAELSRWLAREIEQGRRGSLGISGVEVQVSCAAGAAGGLHVALARDGQPVREEDPLLVVTIGGPTLSGNIASANPLDGGPPENGPVVREALDAWLLRRSTRVEQYDTRSLNAPLVLPCTAASPDR